MSVDEETAEQIARYRELSVPAVEPLMFEHYDFLVERPETGYKQPYLKGRNMRVGQLIYKMRANDLSAEDAAMDMDLPLPQVREAQVYYQVNRDVIEQEAEEEKARLQAAGVQLEPENLSG